MTSQSRGRMAALPSLLALLMGTLFAASLHAQCVDEGALPGKRGTRPANGALAPEPAADIVPAEPTALGNPMEQLQAIAREAVQHSAEARAAGYSAQAAGYDVKEVQGQRYPQINLIGGAFTGHSKVGGQTVGKGANSSVGLNASGPLYDGGKLSNLTQYRDRLAEAANADLGLTHEGVVLEALVAALERNRFRMQVKVYQQYARKMGCLVGSLEQIVAEDRGRASELVQVRKTLRQAEISRDEALAQLRQADVRLRKLVGDNVAPWNAIGTPLLAVPATNDLMKAAEANPEIKRSQAEAQALESYAKAVNAEQQPQVNWVVAQTVGHQGGGVGNTSTVQAGVQVSFNLFSGGSQTAATNAATARANAARQQTTELVNVQHRQIDVLHDAALSAFDRAKRYVDVLRDSDRLRNYTVEQWSQLGRRSLFDVMSTESEHYNLRVAYVNALHDGYIANAQLRSLGPGLVPWLSASAAPATPRAQ